MVTDDEATSTVHKQKLPISHVVLMDKVNAQILVDTGSKVNILDSNTFQKLDPQPKLHRPDQEVFSYGDRPDYQFSVSPPLECTRQLQTAQQMLIFTLYMATQATYCHATLRKNSSLYS